MTWDDKPSPSESWSSKVEDPTSWTPSPGSGATWTDTTKTPPPSRVEAPKPGGPWIDDPRFQNPFNADCSDLTTAIPGWAIPGRAIPSCAFRLTQWSTSEPVTNWQDISSPPIGGWVDK